MSDQDQRSIMEGQGASNIVADAQILPPTSDMASNVDREGFDEVGQYPPAHPQNISQEEQPNNMLELAGCSPLPDNQKKSQSPKEALQNRELKNLRSANVEGKSELAPMPWNRQRKPALAPSRTSYRRALENAQESKWKSAIKPATRADKMSSRKK